VWATSETIQDGIPVLVNLVPRKGQRVATLKLALAVSHTFQFLVPVLPRNETLKPKAPRSKKPE
jgi:hypothetical protein